MQTDEAPGSYIRGGAGVVDTRRLFRVVLGLTVVALAAVVVVLTIQAAQRNTRIDNLRHRGVPVDVTVTSCLGILSGTGVTVTSFQCSGTFDLAGHSYNAVIGGSNVNHAAGDVVKAIADPKHPTSVSTTGSLVHTHSSWRAYIGPAVLFLVLVLLVAGALLWSRRTSAQRARDPDADESGCTRCEAVRRLYRLTAPSDADSAPPAFVVSASALPIAGAAVCGWRSVCGWRFVVVATQLSPATP